MALTDTGTILVISPAGTAAGDTPVLNDYSARGITQTLNLLPGNQRRTINGELVDLTPERFRKYISTITCKDQTIPALDGAYNGQTVTVDCALELSYPTSGGAATRAVVPGSSRTAGTSTFYRPRLTMIVTNIQTDLAEWDGDISWQIDLAEV